MICDAPRVYYILTDRYWSLVDRAASRGWGRKRRDDRTEEGRRGSDGPERAKKRGPSLHTGYFTAEFWLALSNTRSSLWWSIPITERASLRLSNLSAGQLPNNRFCRAQHAARFSNDRNLWKLYIARDVVIIAMLTWLSFNCRLNLLSAT